MRETYTKLYKKCRNILGNINLQSALRIGLALFPIVLIFQLLLPDGTANYQQKLLVKQAEQLARINSLVNPSNMKPGIINSDTRYVIDSTSATVDKISNTDSLLCPAGMSVSIRYGYKCYKAKTNLAKSEQALNRYSATLDTILNFIEYSPQVDFTNYSSGATNTTQRIDFFKEGIEDTVNQIENLGFRNEYTEAIKELVAESLPAIEKLEETGDVGVFSKTLTDVQNQIITVLEANYTESANQARQAHIQLLKDFN